MNESSSRDDDIICVVQLRVCVCIRVWSTVCVCVWSTAVVVEEEEEEEKEETTGDEEVEITGDASG